MSPAPERANAVSAFLIIWGLMSFPAVSSPRRWKNKAKRVANLKHRRKEKKLEAKRKAEKAQPEK